jgi:hypothetical protein
MKVSLYVVDKCIEGSMSLGFRPHIAVWGGRLCHFLDHILYDSFFGDDLRDIIVTKIS